MTSREYRWVVSDDGKDAIIECLYSKGAISSIRAVGFCAVTSASDIITYLACPEYLHFSDVKGYEDSQPENHGRLIHRIHHSTKEATVIDPTLMYHRLGHWFGNGK